MTIFRRELTTAATSDEELVRILTNPGFGKYFTDHMAVIDWDAERGWHDHRVVPYGPLVLDPASVVLHYGQEIFEGLKAFAQPDGSVACFRPQANAARMNRSAARLCMPELPEADFVAAITELVATDRRWVPTDDNQSLYLRPFAIATEVGLGVRPAVKYTFIVLASPAGSYFAGGLKPVTVWLSTDYVRAAPGGTGAVKTGGNYAASLRAQFEAAAKGCDQVVWLDAVQRRWIEEMGTNNVMFVFGRPADADFEIVTPALTGSLLPGITRDSLLTIARDLGYSVVERSISTDEWQQRAEAGEMTEAFGCGTAAVVTPIGTVKYDGGQYTIGDGSWLVTEQLRGELTGIQRGLRPDRHGWMTTLVS